MEFCILNYVQEHFRSPIADQLMILLSRLGEYGTIWIFAALALIYSKQYRNYGFVLLAALAVTAIVGEVVLKNMICRIRPCNIDPSISLLVRRPKGYSFPSGHAASSFAAASILLKANRKIGIAGFSVAAMIAVSRIYLYVHFPTDILAGAILGLLCAQVVFYFFNKKRFVSSPVRYKNRRT